MQSYITAYEKSVKKSDSELLEVSSELRDESCQVEEFKRQDKAAMLIVERFTDLEPQELGSEADFKEGYVTEGLEEYEDETELAAVESANEVDTEMIIPRFAQIAKFCSNFLPPTSWCQRFVLLLPQKLPKRSVQISL
jgi:hypothetical protein